MNDEVSRGLVPPRPNLPPEPWPEPLLSTDILVLLGLFAVLLLAGAGFLWLRRRRAARARPSPLSSPGGSDAGTSPRDRLVALSRAIRDAMALQLGTACRAKTTEELAADDRLAQRLGEPDFHDLIEFLDQIDRVKFAPERSDNHHEALEAALTTWEPRVATLQVKIRTEPRGRSRAR